MRFGLKTRVKTALAMGLEVLPDMGCYEDQQVKKVILTQEKFSTLKNPTTNADFSDLDMKFDRAKDRIQCRATNDLFET